MAVKLNSTGGGSVTLDSPSTASNYTVTLPSAAGTLATTTGTGSVFTNPTINGFTGDTTAITIGTTQFVKDASGNIGIGTATPAYKLDISGTNPRIRLNETTGYVLTSYVNSAGTLDIGRDSSAGAVSGVAYAGFFDLAGAYPYVWRSNSTERMRLDSSGNLYVGGTTAFGAKINCLGNFGCWNATAAISGYVGANVFRVDSTTVPTLEINNQGATGRFVTFQTNGASQVGSISFTNTNTAYNTSSDQRLKTNITPANSAIRSILDFPVDQFDWIESGEHQDFGAVAQKAVNFIPEMVNAPADPEAIWGIDWSKAVPRLVKAIQELSAQNNALEARLAQLEAK